MAYDTAYFDDIFKSILGSSMPMGGTRDMGMPMGGGAMPFAPEPATAGIPMPQPRPMEAPLPPLETRDIPMGGPAPATFGAPPAGSVGPLSSGGPSLFNAVTDFAPTDVQRMSRGQPLIPQTGLPGGGGTGGGAPESSGILGSMFGMSPESARTLRGSIAGGMKGVAEGWNKPAMAAFASGAGGALQGAEKADQYADSRSDTGVNQKFKLIEAAIKAKAEGRQEDYQKAIIDLKTRELEEVKKANAATAAVRAGTDADYKAGRLDNEGRKIETDRAYKEGRNEIGNRNATTREQDSEVYRNNMERGTARSEQKSKIEVDRLLERARTSADKAAGLDQPGLSDKERAKRQAAADGAYEARKSDILTRMAPTTPAAPAPPSMSKPGEISMMGNGAQASPYRPTTPEEYAEIPAGAHYMKNGKIYRKREE